MNDLPPDLKLCNCAGCNVEIVGESCREWWENNKRRMGRVAGRILGRPYCVACLRTYQPNSSKRGSKEPSSSQENAIRELEDAGE